MYQNSVDDIKTEYDDSVVASEEEMPETEFILGTDCSAVFSSQTQTCFDSNEITTIRKIPEFDDYNQQANPSKKARNTATVPRRFAENDQSNSFNAEAIALLKSMMANQETLLENQRNLQARMTRLEKAVHENMMLAKRNVIVENKIIRNVTEKSLISVSRGSEGESQIVTHNTWPLSSMEAAYNIEEKLKKTEYREALTKFVCKVKGVQNVDGVFRKLMTDDLVRYFNWDGRWGKNSLVKFALINSVLFEAFRDDGWNKFEMAMKKSVELSHNRSKQKRYAQKRHEK